MWGPPLVRPQGADGSRLTLVAVDQEVERNTHTRCRTCHVLVRVPPHVCSAPGATRSTRGETAPGSLSVLRKRKMHLHGSILEF